MFSPPAESPTKKKKKKTPKKPPIPPTSSATVNGTIEKVQEPSPPPQDTNDEVAAKVIAPTNGKTVSVVIPKSNGGLASDAINQALDSMLRLETAFNRVAERYTTVTSVVDKLREEQHNLSVKLAAMSTMLFELKAKHSPA